MPLTTVTSSSPVQQMQPPLPAASPSHLPVQRDSMTRSEGESSCGCIASIWKSFVAFLKWIFCCAKDEEITSSGVSSTPESSGPAAEEPADTACEVPSTPENTDPTAEELANTARAALEEARVRDEKIAASEEAEARAEVDIEIEAMSLEEALIALVEEDEKAQKSVSYRECQLYCGVSYEMGGLEGEERVRFLRDLFKHVEGESPLSKVLKQALHHSRPFGKTSPCEKLAVNLAAVQQSILNDSGSGEAKGFKGCFVRALADSLTFRLTEARTEEDKLNLRRLMVSVHLENVLRLAYDVQRGKKTLGEVPQWLRALVEKVPNNMTETRELNEVLVLAETSINLFELQDYCTRVEIREAIAYVAPSFAEGSFLFRTG